MILTHTIIAITTIVFGAFLSLMVWVEKKNRKLTFDITLTSMLIAFALMISYSSFSCSSYLISSSLINNFFSAFIIFISTAILYSHRETINENLKFGEYILLISLTVVSSIILISSDSLFIIFIAIELLSISLYALVGFDKKPSSIEASVKYFITGSFATLFFILSFIFIKYSKATIELSSISHLTPSLPLSLAGIFFLSAMFFKISLVPMHSWAVDVYCGSPTYITAVLTSYIKLAVIIAGYRVYSSFEPHIPSDLINLVIVLTLILPNISALSTKNIKKILVYSGISHAGFISIGFLTSSNPYLYFYIIVYSITAMGAFMLIYLIEKVQLNTEYEAIGELWRKDPIIVIFLLIFLFSLAGIPPFAGFFAKFYIFYSAIISNHTIIAIIAALSSAVAAYYYIKILIPLFKQKTNAVIQEQSVIKENPYTFSLITISAISL
ncbi:MAG: NADH-quinone oxidoreductase subunit N, partial [Elusimicrobiales bacterium]